MHTRGVDLGGVMYKNGSQLSQILFVKETMTTVTAKPREVFWSNLIDEVVTTEDYLSIMLGEQHYEEAAKVNQSDLQELFGDFLPDLTGLEVLELAAGSG